MYHQKSYNLNQLNIVMKSQEFGMDTGIHRLNPLFVKCRNK